MRCLVCNSEYTHEERVNIFLQRDKRLVVMKGVPAIVCSDCGDRVFSSEVTRLVQERMKELHLPDEIECFVDYESSEERKEKTSPL